MMNETTYFRSWQDAARTLVEIASAYGLNDLFDEFIDAGNDNSIVLADRHLFELALADMKRFAGPAPDPNDGELTAEETAHIEGLIERYGVNPVSGESGAPEVTA